MVKAALLDEGAFFKLVGERAAQISEFLSWASSREACGADQSLRFEHRPDIKRCQRVLRRFGEPWWGIVVYSCFDSICGTEAVASEFTEPLPTPSAESAITRIAFPNASVQHHRAQVTLTRAKRSLVSACGKADALKHALVAPGLTFEQRFEQLDQIHVCAWGRTTNFDSLARGGSLKVDGFGYRPQRAHLRGSQGPAAGFERIWGIPVTVRNAGDCEELLVRWTSAWGAIAGRVGGDWSGRPYDSADFENALCIFRERH